MIYKDQLGNDVALSSPPKRIISIVPSQTELLFDLGLNEEIVGITKYCIHPGEKLAIRGIRGIRGIREIYSAHLPTSAISPISPIPPLQIIGGTKKLNLDLIRKLQPDLIIGNKEENEKSQIEELMKEFPVWMSDIKTFEHAMEMIVKIGELVNKKEKAAEIRAEIQNRFITFSLYLPSAQNRRSMLYLIWRKPFIAAGPDTFISHLMKLCALPNAITSPSSRYPEISAGEIQNLKPTHIFLSSEPYPFKEKHLAELQAICPNAKVILVDGEMFSWYGSRLLHAPAYFSELLKNL